MSIEEYAEPPEGDSYGLAPTARASGRALHRVINLAPRAEELPSPAPPPAWLAWDHPGAGLWPPPDDGPEDLNAIDTPSWLGDAAQRVRSVLQSATLPPVIGHGDWEAQNVFWSGGRLAVVHDWDSLVLLPESAIVGAAAGVFAVSGSEPSWPTLEDSREFLYGYLEARERGEHRVPDHLDHTWSVDDEHVFWAAGLWVHLFNATKAAARDELTPYAERTRLRVRERLQLI